MKRNYAFILIAFLFFANAAYSQLDKNTWLVGGTGTLFSHKDNHKSETYYTESKYTEISIAASIGYFAVDKLAFGLRPTFTSEKGRVTTPGGGYGNTKRYAIGPFARYYLLSSEKPFNILADVCYQYGRVNHLKRNKGNINSFSAMIGPVIYFNTSVGVELLVGYSYKKEEIKDSYLDKRKGFQTSIGFQIHLEKE